MKTTSLADACGKKWDAVVVGGGMGGAAISFSLTRGGFDVLLIERGLAEPIRGQRSSDYNADDEDWRFRYGQWPKKTKLTIDGRSSEAWPSMGCGLGGSTNLYAAALSRFEASDFLSKESSGSYTESWPFDYQDLEPYYLEAEELFEINGTQDPLDNLSRYELRDPPPMGPRDQHYFDCLKSTGLNPYRIHNAIRYVDSCQECVGNICERACKGDARNRLIEPALRTGCLTILETTEALSVDASRSQASGVRVRKDGVESIVHGHIVVLAAGSLVTPILLRNSISPDWRQGIGNDFDQVGRKLMFHATDFIAVWPRKKIQHSGPSRTIAFRDFYLCGEDKLGEVQSMGMSAGYGEILTFLHQQFDQSIFSKIPFIRSLLRVPAFVASKMFSDAAVFATIVEDLPYAENRVVSDPDSPSGFRVEYAIAPELRRRVIRMRDLVKGKLRDLRVLVVNSDVTLNLGHACGTCAVGSDPETSVLDSNCLVHGMKNLYVVDASFMKTSGGTNPSLTIAANALRVGRHASSYLSQMYQ
ncbi:MAG: GMC family oxidoreductase [Pseudomonadaceae bacterium]|nr:GMC family oxidoreductase [Pseudomonadaceae bacterium]